MSLEREKNIYINRVQHLNVRLINKKIVIWPDLIDYTLKHTNFSIKSIYWIKKDYSSDIPFDNFFFSSEGGEKLEWDRLTTAKFFSFKVGNSFSYFSFSILMNVYKNAVSWMGQNAGHVSHFVYLASK